jgi:hypothetical protein
MNDLQKIDLSGTNDDVARWIWRYLVPKSGQADSVHGEILRTIEKLRWEAQENGNINWDDRFEMLVDFLGSTLADEGSFTEETRASIAADLGRLRHFVSPDKLESRSQVADLPYVKDDLYDRLASHLVSYCRQHPQLIPHPNDPRQYR